MMRAWSLAWATVGGRDDPVAGEDSPRVGVDNEDRTASRVEKDGVGGLRADPGQGQELLAEPARRPAEHPPEPAIVAHGQVVHEGAQPSSLGAERARWTEQRGQPTRAEAGQALRREPAGRAESSDRPLDLGSRRVRRQDGADHDLEGRASGPPALRPVATIERFVEPHEPVPHGTRALQGEPRHGAGIIG